MTNKHVFGFSNNGQLFAIINNDGVLRIWDTDRNVLQQEYKPNLHLSDPCTALTWITVSFQLSKGGKSKKITGIDELPYISLGTNKGMVLLYSYAEAKIERTLKGDGHSGKVTCVVAGDSRNLYTCGADNQVIEWAVPDEEQLSSWSVGPETPSSMAYFHSSHIIAVGSRQIKLYSAKNHELLYTLSGHASEIYMMQSISATEFKEFVVTTACMEQNICIWEIGKKRNTCYTLIIEDTVRSLTCKINNDIITVACVSKNGGIYFYSVDVKSIKFDKPLKPNLKINIASDNANNVEPLPALAITLQHSYKEDEILFGYGDERFLVFDHIKPNPLRKTQVLLRNNPKSVLKETGTKGKMSDNKETLKYLTPVIDEVNVHHKSVLNSSKNKIKSLDMPMETRLQNLRMDVSAKLQSHSKVQLLMQALHSKDTILLRSVLNTKDTATIQLTLQRLPIHYIGTLVNELTLLMQQKHMHVEYSVIWLKILCQNHYSYLVTLGADDLLSKFGTCLGVIEHRTNCLKDLSKLNGRLQLLVSQIKRNIEGQTSDLNNENILVFEDGDSSESPFDLEEDNVKYMSDEWGEDECSADESADQKEMDEEINDSDFELNN